MEIKISTYYEGTELQVIDSGNVIIERSQVVNFSIEGLNYEFHFSEPQKNERIITSEIINSNDAEPKLMKLTVRIVKNELNSVFVPPTKIGTTDDNTVIYLSFNARSLDGSSSNCILLIYTFFRSK